MKPKAFDRGLYHFTQRYRDLLFAAAVLILAVWIRILNRHFVSIDARDYLLPWFQTIKDHGGFASLSGQVGNYNIAYQTIIALFTYLPLNSLTSYKLFSCVFDLFLAANVYALLMHLQCSREKALAGFACVLLLPTVFLNSSAWAQCDSVYVSLILLFLNLYFRKHMKSAFFVLGLAFTFKLQTVFILPFVIFAYFVRQDFSLLNVLLTFAGFYLPCLPGVIVRKDAAAPFSIYFGQTGAYPSMYMRFPSFWVLAGDHYQSLHRIAILVTVAVLIAELFLVLSDHLKGADAAGNADSLKSSDNSGKTKPLKKGNDTATAGVLKAPKSIEKKKSLGKAGDFDMLKLCILTVWTVLLFLPAMHDRYGYLLEILLVLISVADYRYMIFSIPVELIGFCSYCSYLYRNAMDIRPAAYIYIALFSLYFILFLRQKSSGRTSSPGASSDLQNQ